MSEGGGVRDAGGATARDPVQLWVGSLGAQVPRPGHHLQARGEVHIEGQTRLVSLIESLCNVTSGWLLSLMVWQYAVAPLFGYEVTLSTNIALTSIFTGVSIGRGYLWRRFFARNLHRTVVRAVQSFWRSQ